MKTTKIVWSLVVVAAVLGLGAYLIGCYDGKDLGAGHIVTEGPGRPSNPFPQQPPVEKAESAIIQAGMRSCCAPPEQQPGEVVVRRWNHTQEEPWYPNGNYPSNAMILQNNGRWPELLAANGNSATYYSGWTMAQYIKEATFRVPSGYCAGFKPYAEDNYGSPYTFLGNWVCRPSWQPGEENWLLWNTAWNIKSMKTALVACGTTYCTPPADY